MEPATSEASDILLQEAAVTGDFVRAGDRTVGIRSCFAWSLVLDPSHWSLHPTMSTAPAPALAKTMSCKTESEKRVVATTLSMAGRVYKCCANACNESFPSMHQLMNHLKTHYKPNRYYKCPSCKSRFQKHQSYSKHVSVCGREVKRLPPELDPPARPPAAAEPVKFQSVIRQLGRAGSVPSSKPVALFPDTLPSLHSSLSSMPLLPATPHPFPLLEPSEFPQHFCPPLLDSF